MEFCVTECNVFLLQGKEWLVSKYHPSRLEAKSSKWLPHLACRTSLFSPVWNSPQVNRPVSRAWDSPSYPSPRFLLQELWMRSWALHRILLKKRVCASKATTSLALSPWTLLISRWWLVSQLVFYYFSCKGNRGISDSRPRGQTSSIRHLIKEPQWWFPRVGFEGYTLAFAMLRTKAGTYELLFWHGLGQAMCLYQECGISVT